PSLGVWYTTYQRYWEKPLIALLHKDGGRRTRDGGLECNFLIPKWPVRNYNVELIRFVEK
ncbi:MAG: hypothetical protein ACYSW7_01380, partial [Planctomycetota bacterium]